MTTRNPLVRVSGKIIDLPAADVLGGAAQGPPGMTWQGAWNSGTSYAIDDAVSSGGSSYIAIAANTNQAPPNATYWNVLASQGSTGATGPTGPTGPTGAAGTGLVQIAKVTTASSQATIVFSSIAATYQALRIIVMGRDTSSSVNNSNLFMYFNADQTAANYITQNSGVSGGTAVTNQPSATTNGAPVGVLPGTSLLATAHAVNEIVIPFYANTTFHKGVISTAWGRYGTTTNVIVVTRGSSWLSTAAITTITLTAGGTAFLDGSQATLYGMN